MKHNQRNDGTEQRQLLRIPTGQRQTSWLFTSAAGKLNQEQIQRVVRAGLPYNPELRADKRVIFTLARFPQGCQKN